MTIEQIIQNAEYMIKDCEDAIKFHEGRRDGLQHVLNLLKQSRPIPVTLKQSGPIPVPNAPMES